MEVRPKKELMSSFVTLAKLWRLNNPSPNDTEHLTPSGNLEENIDVLT